MHERPGRGAEGGFPDNMGGTDTSKEGVTGAQNDQILCCVRDHVEDRASKKGVAECGWMWVIAGARGSAAWDSRLARKHFLASSFLLGSLRIARSETSPPVGQFPGRTGGRN